MRVDCRWFSIQRRTANDPVGSERPERTRDAKTAPEYAPFPVPLSLSRTHGRRL